MPLKKIYKEDKEGNLMYKGRRYIATWGLPQEVIDQLDDMQRNFLERKV